MSETPGDRAWPQVAVAVWLAGTVGLVALTTSGPLLRPGAQMSPIGLALALVVSLVIGWPLLTHTSKFFLLVAGQGAILLAIDAAAHARTSIDVARAFVIWLAAAGLALGLRAIGRRCNAVDRVWLGLVLGVGGAIALILGWKVV